MDNEFHYRSHRVQLYRDGDGFLVLIDGDKEEDISGLPFELAATEARRLIDSHETAMGRLSQSDIPF